MGPGSREISSEQQFHVDFCRVRLLTTGRRGVFCEGAIETERKHKGGEELSLSLKISEKSTFPGKNVVHQMDLMTDLLGKPSMDTISWTKYLHIRIKRYGGKRPLSLVKIKTTWDILGAKLTWRESKRPFVPLFEVFIDTAFLRCQGMAQAVLNCRTTPGKLYVGVGDPNADHKCWERPEDMDTPHTVYSVSPSNPGSDVAAETAAALAAASMVFKEVDSAYSLLLLATAKNVMQFAIQYRGSYSDSLSSSVCPFYCSYSGYKDELMWGAAWLLKATDDSNYKNFIQSLGGGDHPDIFNWDNKYAGAYVLLSQQALVNNDNTFDQYKQEAESFICKILPNTPSSSTSYTPEPTGGLMYNYNLPQSNLQHVMAITFLLTTYAKYMKATQHTFN
ncbi:hypothetical protein HID58_073243 [Brassica napus]|uniref:cellulase n=1 Tax=Brassica napus TaxID=3708 RepID=A0ABQ7Z6R1_BRANA|nr:hypothetical protein HID58_073243 [Brassica napus]